MEDKRIIVAILTDVEEARGLKSATYLNSMPADKRDEITAAIEALQD